MQCQRDFTGHEYSFGDIIARTRPLGIHIQVPKSTYFFLFYKYNIRGMSLVFCSFAYSQSYQMENADGFLRNTAAQVHMFH